MPDLIQTPADPAAPAAIPPPAVPSGGVDTSSPAFVEAVNEAVQVALKNHDDRVVAAVKGDKTKLQEKLAAESEARKTVEDKLAELELAASAAAADTTPDKLKIEVESRVAREREILGQQRALVDEEKDKRIAELEEENAKSIERESETWFMAQLSAATTGDGWRSGAAKRLYAELKPYMVRAETPAGDAIRFRDANGHDVPGSGPKGLMTIEQLLGLPPETQGKTIPDFDSSFYQQDHGNGSNTRKPEGSAAAFDYFLATDDQQTEFINTHTRAEVKAAQRESNARKRRRQAA